VRGEDGKVTYRQRGEDLEVSQKLLNIQVGGGQQGVCENLGLEAVKVLRTPPS
jgi:hypothetical protein